jgi:hypothetical protein
MEAPPVIDIQPPEQVLFDVVETVDQEAISDVDAPVHETEGSADESNAENEASDKAKKAKSKEEENSDQEKNKFWSRDDLTPHVRTHSADLLRCPWMGDAVVTVSEAMTNYGPMQEEEQDSIIARLEILVDAYKQELEEMQKEDLPENETAEEEVPPEQPEQEEDLKLEKAGKKIGDETETKQAREDKRAANAKVVLNNQEDQVTQKKVIQIKAEAKPAGAKEADAEITTATPEQVSKSPPKPISAAEAKPPMAIRELNMLVDAVEAPAAAVEYDEAALEVVPASKENVPNIELMEPLAVQDFYELDSAIAEDTVSSWAEQVEYSEPDAELFAERDTEPDSQRNIDIEFEPREIFKTSSGPQFIELIDEDNLGPGSKLQSAVGHVVEAKQLVIMQEGEEVSLEHSVETELDPYEDALVLYPSETEWTEKLTAIEEIGEQLAPLAEAAQTGEPTVVEEIANLLGQIELPADIGEQKEGSTIQDQNPAEAEKLIARMLEQAGIEPSAELVEALVRQDRGTHEAINEWIAGSGSAQKAMDRARAIGKPALELTRVAA